MRLEFVISEMGVGGAERMLVELLRDATDRGDELALLGAPGRLDAQLEGLGVLRAPLPNSRSPWAVASAIGRTARFTHSFSPALIHAHNVRVTAIARLGSQLANPMGRPPLLTTYHGVPHEEVDRAARVLRLADLVACVSDDLGEQLASRGVDATKLAVVPNGVPDAAPLSEESRRRIDSELGLGPQTAVVSVVGRLVPQKAHDRFLRAAAIVKQRLPDTRFLAVGDGPLRDQNEALAAELGLGDNVVFTGIRDDAADVIARSDLLVFSSDMGGPLDRSARGDGTWGASRLNRGRGDPRTAQRRRRHRRPARGRGAGCGDL